MNQAALQWKDFCFLLEEQDGFITSIRRVESLPDIQGEESPLLVRCKEELQEYFDGKRTSFDLPLNPSGSDFDKKVWKVMQTIPYSKTWTYKQLGKAAGYPNAPRAMGLACKKNSILIMIPCHRVTKSDGTMGGFSAGLDLKKELLALELEHMIP